MPLDHPTTVPDRIVDVLREADRPLTPREIADRSESSYDTIRKLVGRMEQDDEIERVGGSNNRGFTYGIKG